ncbi:ribonuclease Z [Christiangramia aquimixticola]|uniref:ribonuclease Z n=1 Tax=Christiangramia aquimixticola TaxID=1697558 RepID=UPI003AA7D342
MKTIEKENYLLIEPEEASLTDFTSALTKNHSTFKEKNVILDLHKFREIMSENLLSFLELSNVHRNENKSFVIVNDALGIDELPDELVVVPTVLEAEDMIQMDEIQRDLGF